MKYKTFLKNHLGHILGVSLLGIFTSLAMVYAGYSLSFFYTAYECSCTVKKQETENKR